MKTPQKYRSTVISNSKNIKRTQPSANLKLEHGGKTKRIWSLPSLHYVAIENTDYLTAHNGLDVTTISNKGWYSTRTSKNCFRLLHRQGIPNHFLSPLNSWNGGNTFWASKLKMIPVEFVVRLRAYGSYLKRYPETHPAEAFSEPIVEFFEKNDNLNDPWLVVNHDRGIVGRYKPDHPQGPGSLIGEWPIDKADHLMLNYWASAASIVRDAALILQKAWAESGATLIDIKFECGITADSQVLIGDSIDADCWRLWRNNDSSDALDRQLFKHNCTPEHISDTYRFVMEQTDQW